MPRTNRAHLGALLLALAGGITGGCAPGGDARDLVTMRDSAGVTIAENVWADSADAVWWALTPGPQTDIGTLEGPEEQTLFRVTGAVRMSDGRIVVANGGTSEIRYYDAAGRHLLTTGRQGGGPGEFQRLSRLIALAGDSVAVIDGGARRVSILDGTGAFSGDHPTGGPDAPVNLVGRAPDGGWIASSSIVADPGQLQNGLGRRNISYVRLSSDGTTVTDTIGTFAGPETFMRIDQGNGQIRSISIMTSLPFRKSTVVVVHGDELFVATQDAPEILVYGMDGALRRIVRTGAPSPPVTQEMIEAWTDRRVATMPPERRAAAREAALALPAGETVPPYGVIAVDRVGRLWVQDPTGLVDDPAWTVYDPEGAQIARIAVPGRFTPLDIGEDWILGRETDELDVEHVRLYGIVGAAG